MNAESEEVIICEEGQEKMQISSLAPQDVEFLQEMRDFAKRIIANSIPEASAAGELGTAQLQFLYDGGLHEGITEQDYYDALAVAFGDFLVREGELEWVILSDEQGRIPVVAVPGKFVYASPIDMIFKRVENAETVDFEVLVTNTLQTLEDQASQEGIEAR